MATAVHIPVSEYLRSTYHPDRDYVDGELEERNLGEQLHGLVQNAIGAIFFSRYDDWKLRPITEQRVQVAPNRFRIPDVCVVRAGEAIQRILRTPPLLCVEILSPEDRLQRIVLRAMEYQRMGVPDIWIIDPESRECWTLNNTTGLTPMLDEAFTIPETAVRVTLREVFRIIDSTPKE